MQLILGMTDKMHLLVKIFTWHSCICYINSYKSVILIIDFRLLKKNIDFRKIHFKDICGFFQCTPFPRLETGKFVWILSFDLLQIRINTAFRYFLWKFDVPTFSWQNKVIKVCLKYLLTFYQIWSSKYQRQIRGMFKKICLFLSGDLKFQVSPKLLISCHQRTPGGWKCKISDDVTTTWRRQIR